MPSSTRVKYPENYRKRRLWFRLANPVKQTTRQILAAPELPFSLQKRASVRSHDDTHSASSDVRSHGMVRKIDEPDDDNDDDEMVEPQIQRSGAGRRLWL